MHPVIRRHIAEYAQLALSIQHDFWLANKDHRFAPIRKLALKAKAGALVQHDRFLERANEIVSGAAGKESDA